jgi:hypothetical protein
MSVGGVEVRRSRFRRRHEMEVGANWQGRDACCDWEGFLGYLERFCNARGCII